MPILWEEPFGIVMAEAMACGTPVLGLARGAVPEVIEHEVTGFVADHVDGLVAAAGNIGEIESCRLPRTCGALFSSARSFKDICAVTEMIQSTSASK